MTKSSISSCGRNMVRYGMLPIIGFISLTLIYYYADQRYVTKEQNTHDSVYTDKKLDSISDDIRDLRKEINDVKLLLINRSK